MTLQSALKNTNRIDAIWKAVDAEFDNMEPGNVIKPVYWCIDVC